MSLLPDLERSFLEAAERHDREVSPAVEVPALAPSPGSRGSRRGAGRWRLRLTLVGGLGIAAAAAVALVPSPSSAPQRPLDPLDRAAAALSPSDGMLYVKLSSRSYTTIGGRRTRASGTAAITQRTEEWSTRNPRRYRLVVHESTERSRWNPKVALQPHIEYAWGDGAQTTYNASHRSMRTVTGLGERSSASTSMAVVGGASLSLDDLRRLLARSVRRERDTVQLGGRPALRLVGDAPADAHARVEYLVDPLTFRPRRVIVRMWPFYARTKREGMVFTSVTDILRYEHLALTAENERLLEIRPPAGTKIRTETLEQARARIKERSRQQEARGRQRARDEERERDRTRAAPTPRP